MRWRRESFAFSARIGLFFLCGLAVFSVYYAGFLGGRPTFWADTYEYAQVGRNVAEGRGLDADSATTMEMWVFRDRADAPPVPYFFHDVGQSLLLALFFKVFGAGDGTIGWASGLFFALLVPLVHLLGAGVFESRWTAALAAALVCLNTQLIAFSATGLTEVPFAFFLTLLLYLVYGARSYWRLCLAGVVHGALIVLRANSLPFLPFVALYLCLDTSPTASAGTQPAPAERPTVRRAAARLVPFLLGLLLVLGPNMLRNYRTLGHPLKSIVTGHLLLLHTSAIKGKSKEIFSQPGFSVDPFEFFAQHPSELPLKVKTQLLDALEMLLNGGQPGGRNWSDAILLFIFILAMLSPPSDETQRQRRFRWLVVGLILTMFLVGAVIHLRWRYLYGFFPVILIYDAELLSRVLRRSGGYGMDSGGSAWAGPWLPGAIVVLLLATLGAGRLREEIDSPVATDARERDNYYRALGEFVRANTRKGARILAKDADSGELWALGWYGRRPVVQFTGYTLELLTSRSRSEALFLLATSGHGEGRTTDVDLPGFTLVKTWHAGSGDSASLSRWTPPSAAQP